MAVFCFAQTEFRFPAWRRKIGNAVGGLVKLK